MPYNSHIFFLFLVRTNAIHCNYKFFIVLITNSLIVIINQLYFNSFCFIMSDSSGAAILSSLLGGLKKRWFIIAVIIAITCAHAYTLRLELNQVWHIEIGNVEPWIE